MKELGQVEQDLEAEEQKLQIFHAL
jgi:hypothetical protein